MDLGGFINPLASGKRYSPSDVCYFTLNTKSTSKRSREGWFSIVLFILGDHDLSMGQCDTLPMITQGLIPNVLSLFKHSNDQVGQPSQKPRGELGICTW